MSASYSYNGLGTVIWLFKFKIFRYFLVLSLKSLEECNRDAKFTAYGVDLYPHCADETRTWKGTYFLHVNSEYSMPKI